MGSLQLIGDASPVTLKFRAHVSQEYIDELIDETGIRPPEAFEVTFDLEELADADHRRRLRLAHERYDKINYYPVLRRPEEEPGPFLDLLEPWLEKAEKEAQEQAAAEERKEQEEEAAKSRFDEEMKVWIVEHGSERLQLAAEGDYRSNTGYALERSKKEMPGFWVDTAKEAEWGERVDPSEEALLLEKSIRTRIEDMSPPLTVRIVWLTETPRALDHKMEEEGLEFEAQEALIVDGYLGRYLLVMPLESELRRDPEENY